MPFQMPAAFAPPLLSARVVIAGRAERSAAPVPAHILAAGAARIRPRSPDDAAVYPADRAVMPPEKYDPPDEPSLLLPPEEVEIPDGAQIGPIITNTCAKILDITKKVIERLRDQLYVLMEKNQSLYLQEICHGIIPLSDFLSETGDIVLLNMQIEFIRFILRTYGVNFKELSTGVDIIYAMKDMKKLLGPKNFLEIFDRLDLFERTAKREIITPLIQMFLSMKKSGIEEDSLKEVLEGLAQEEKFHLNLLALTTASKLYESPVLDLRLKKLLPETDTVFPAGYRTARIAGGELRVDSAIEHAELLTFGQFGITVDDKAVLFASAPRRGEEFDISYDEPSGRLIRSSKMTGPVNDVLGWWMAAEANRLGVRRGTILIVSGGITPRARNLFWRLHPGGTIIDLGDRSIIKYLRGNNAAGEPVEFEWFYINNHLNSTGERPLTPLAEEIRFNGK